jgi:hypothetical protein
MPIVSFMLHCKRQYAAMQTKALLLVSGMPKWVLEHDAMSHRLHESPNMSKTASLPLASSGNLFGRLMAAIDRLLMTSARAAIRNGDLPYFGL